MEMERKSDQNACALSAARSTAHRQFVRAISYSGDNQHSGRCDNGRCMANIYMWEWCRAKQLVLILDFLFLKLCAALFYISIHVCDIYETPYACIYYLWKKKASGRCECYREFPFLVSHIYITYFYRSRAAQFRILRLYTNYLFNGMLMCVCILFGIWLLMQTRGTMGPESLTPRLCDVILNCRWFWALLRWIWIILS